MRRIVFGLLLLASFQSYLYAVDNLRLADVRSISMGGNEVTQSAFFNPSLIALSESKSIQINYFNKYLLKELSTVNVSFRYPDNLLSAGVDIFSFGYDAYRESMFRLSLSKQLSEKWSLGVSVQYTMLQTELTERTILGLSTDLGITIHPVDNLLVGMLIMNLPSVPIKNKEVEIKDFMPYLLQLGFQWEIINDMLIIGSLGTSKEHILLGNAGFEYTVFNVFHIRGGIRGKPFIPSFGFGYDLSSFTINTAATYHSVLGISTGIGLSFSF
ncbi:hypothetical protein [Parabacteroides bouchesdurhonensis]|uniref:hypothetical protein n=1 Tax=Parabacteroides bouchesdurhonensis TaxID=1936995 RepID=UPI000E507A4F|nr:hypothetical protein [Parabacteroides bouchesdurhonensis]RHJ94061.1 hypothetical protein DW095_03475 [Bacteroides sp. AM07-16]